jgi:hypothetical protein
MKSLLVSCSDSQACTREEEKTSPLTFMQRDSLSCHFYIISKTVGLLGCHLHVRRDNAVGTYCIMGYVAIV